MKKKQCNPSLEHQGRSAGPKSGETEKLLQSTWTYITMLLEQKVCSGFGLIFYAYNVTAVASATGRWGEMGDDSLALVFSLVSVITGNLVA